MQVFILIFVTAYIFSIFLTEYVYSWELFNIYQIPLHFTLTVLLESARVKRVDDCFCCRTSLNARLVVWRGRCAVVQSALVCATEDTNASEWFYKTIHTSLWIFVCGEVKRVDWNSILCSNFCVWWSKTYRSTFRPILRLSSGLGLPLHFGLF
jgi:hypothetical protein